MIVCIYNIDRLILYISELVYIFSCWQQSRIRVVSVCSDICRIVGSAFVAFQAIQNTHAGIHIRRKLSHLNEIDLFNIKLMCQGF